MTASTVLVFAKPPQIGLAKTRLARSLDRTSARRIARFTMSRTLRACRQSLATPFLIVTPANAVQLSLGGLWPEDLFRADQGKGDLSDRLNRGLQTAPMGKVLFIGADAPDITPALINQALKALDRSEAVFGPASDGGFWLFGLKKGVRTHSPFAGVRWSTEHALADVRANLNTGARIRYLPQLIDIDTADDWSDWIRQKRNA